MKRAKRVALLMGLLVACSVGGVRADGATARRQPQRIVWQKDVNSAYRLALKGKKPLVVAYFCPADRKKCMYCKAMKHGLLFSPQIQKLSDEAVWVMVELSWNGPAKDRTAGMLARRLEIKSRPAITILEPNPRMIQERARLSGNLAPGKLAAYLQKKLSKPVRLSMPKKK